MEARIQTEPIDVCSMIESIRNENSGAIVTFQGTVRKMSDDVEVQSLFYESYKEMAEPKLQSIINEAINLYELVDANVVHRIGEVNLKEDSVVVVAASAHRSNAFRGCEYIIDRVKAEAPIWKMDITKKGERIWH